MLCEILVNFFSEREDKKRQNQTNWLRKLGDGLYIYFYNPELWLKAALYHFLWLSIRGKHGILRHLGWRTIKEQFCVFLLHSFLFLIVGEFVD